VGVSPTGVKARSPVAWITTLEETKLLKLIDEAVSWTVSELSGRNESELIGGLVKNRYWRPSPLVWGEGSMRRRIWVIRRLGSNGVVEAAR
jgi:hypothetical protein